jgi:UDP-N-acetylmuramyl pentapeptide phosphotransferase/UDP-N-acetylglucosamine-1-phosphate transferase
MTHSSFADSVLRRRAAVQMGYAALFATFVLWPNLRAAPSVLLVAATALAAIWLVGGLAAWVKLPRADELLLCGAAAPLMVGLTLMAYRLDFLRVHRALARPGVEGDSATAFAAVWAAEVVFVLLPGVLFVWWNARALTPVEPPTFRVHSARSRPSSPKSRK